MQRGGTKQVTVARDLADGVSGGLLTVDELVSVQLTPGIREGTRWVLPEPLLASHTWGIALQVLQCSSGPVTLISAGEGSVFRVSCTRPASGRAPGGCCLRSPCLPVMGGTSRIVHGRQHACIIQTSWHARTGSEEPPGGLLGRMPCAAVWDQAC